MRRLPLLAPGPLVVLATLTVWGCADLRTEPVSADLIYGADGEQISVQEPIAFEARTGDNRYGLPRDGEPAIADLLALFPARRLNRDERNLWVAAGDEPPTDQCQGGGPNVSDALPMEIEAVVTLHPRQYVKTPFCGQDERNYGTFVIEDDTGGIIMLRDSRVAPYTVGDIVRVRVRAAVQAFGDPEQRMVVTADVEPTGRRVPVRYDQARENFSAADIGLVRRIEGTVVIPPTSQNFNLMTIAAEAFPTPGSTTPSPLCTERCASACRGRCPSDGDLLCRTQICPAACSQGDGSWDPSLLPSACWDVNIDAELGRRGFAPARGERVAVTGPVVSAFGRKIWVLRIGQVERLSPASE